MHGYFRRGALILVHTQWYRHTEQVETYEVTALGLNLRTHTTATRLQNLQKMSNKEIVNGT